MHDPFQPGRRRLLAGTAAGAATALLQALVPSRARAAAPVFPSRPVRLIVPYSAGSGTDIVARVYARTAGAIAGQPFIIENRAGAKGVIGARAVLSAPADGYTVLFGSGTVLATNAALVKGLPYDPLRDFAPLTILDSGYCMVVVPAASPFRTFAELAAEARRRPGALNHGAGTTTYAMWNAWLDSLVGMKTINVMYKGSGDSLNAAVSGQVDYAILNASVADPMIRAGKLRALLYTDSHRSSMWPAVPAAPEAGGKELAGFRAFAWSAVAVRAGTPDDIARTLADMFMRAARHRDVHEVLARMGFEPMVTGPEGMRRFQQDEIARAKRLAAESRIVME
ncbi:Bug family tripartite tricarboxylate transporter substrate binding protein [Cupriavidus pinatubonensis]|uniref:Bug family tripartite tricarboxylate transporter substrate binding protein n=1 Tax=Cupriavidus pinatubonensis TaxID=248026 RepID=UPI003614F954